MEHFQKASGYNYGSYMSVVVSCGLVISLICFLPRSQFDRSNDPRGQTGPKAVVVILLRRRSIQIFCQNLHPLDIKSMQNDPGVYLKAYISDNLIEKKLGKVMGYNIMAYQYTCPYSIGKKSVTMIHYKCYSG